MRGIALCLCLALGSGLLGGCSGEGTASSAPGQSSATAPPPATSPNARTLPIPGASDPTAVAPQGAPPALIWAVPAGWIEEPPASQMRKAQYRVDGTGGAGSCLVFYFGPGQGGDALSNARRWAGQFAQPDGRPSSDVMKVTELTSTPLPAQLVEVTGTYEGGMSMTDEPAPRLPGYMLLGAIVEGPDAPWFFKFTGPESTVREQREAFLEMIASIRTHG